LINVNTIRIESLVELRHHLNSELLLDVSNTVYLVASYKIPDALLKLLVKQLLKSVSP
jgi:hypothetical protein